MKRKASGERPPRKRRTYLPLTRVSYVKGAGRAREALDMARDAIPFPCRDEDQCERQGCQTGNPFCAFYFRPKGGDSKS